MAKEEIWLKRTKKGGMPDIAKVITLVLVAMVVANGVIGFFEQLFKNQAAATIAYISVLALANLKLFEVWK